MYVVCFCCKIEATLLFVLELCFYFVLSIYEITIIITTPIDEWNTEQFYIQGE